MNENKIMSNKERRYKEVHQDKSLRRNLVKLAHDEIDLKVIVIHNDNVMGIGTADFLLNHSSLRFKNLLNMDVKDTLKGVSLYLTV